MTNKKQFDLAIIGGGAAGLVIASVSAQLGLKVCLIEQKDKLGGDCLHTGCIPSKSLIQVAKVAHQCRQAERFGLSSHMDEIDLGRIADHVQSIIDEIQPHDDPERFREYGCDVRFGQASFVNSQQLAINRETISAQRFVIATGSRPFIPPIEGLDQVPYLTNESLFSLRSLPRRLAVLGGGPIGLEMAQAFSRLGSQVQIIERLPQLLPLEDPEITALLQTHLISEGIEVSTETEIIRATKTATEIVLQSKQGQQFSCDALLIAVGRRPDIESLKLQAAGVKFSPKGILVDKRMRSSQKHIFACGDVCGPFAFTHMAEYQAGIVIGNVVFRLPRKADYRVVPKVTFTDPELASVGLSEAQAIAQGIKPLVLRFPFKDIDRGITDRQQVGMSKLVVHKNRLIGATIFGPHAGELIHELCLAMKTGTKISELSATIHAYPSLSQIHRRCVNSWYGEKLFSPASRRLVHWINRLLP